MLSLLVCQVFCLRHMLHMLQLNSYQQATHFRWIKKNIGQLLPLLVPAALCIPAALLDGWGNVFAPLLAAVLLLLALHFRPRKAKKPLVCTKRMQRLFVTSGVLLAAEAAVCILAAKSASGAARFYPIVGALTLLSPLLASVAAWINAPIERAIRGYYIRDAKRLLQSCPDLITVGVTGSYGKTSVKHILSVLLQAKYNTLMTPESYNTPMGVVLTVRKQLRPVHQVFVCEMGARHVGDIAELCRIAHPKYGVITSVGPQHLETFGTMENIKKTKFELVDALPPDGAAFLNFEDENVRAAAASYRGRQIRYGLSDTCDYYATDIRASSRGTSFTAHTPNGESAEFTVRLIGRHSVINLIGAIAVCCELGIPLEALRVRAHLLESVPHRLQLLVKIGVTLIDDAYNSNPSGAKAALDALALFDGFRILVTPGMVELGSRQYELNRQFGEEAAAVCDYVIAVGEKQAVPIVDGLRAAGCDENKIYVAPDIHAAIERAYALGTDGREKIILLENDLPDNY